MNTDNSKSNTSAGIYECVSLLCSFLRMFYHAINLEELKISGCSGQAP